MTMNLTVKDCKNATVKTYQLINGKFPYYIQWKTVLDINFVM